MLPYGSWLPIIDTWSFSYWIDMLSTKNIMDGELHSREIRNILRICDLSNGKCKIHLHIYDTVQKSLWPKYFLEKPRKCKSSRISATSKNGHYLKLFIAFYLSNQNHVVGFSNTIIYVRVKKPGLWTIIFFRFL